MRTIPKSAQAVLDLIGRDPHAAGNLWFFDPTSEGDPTGELPEKALRTAADWNAAKFETGDRLALRAGTTATLDRKIRNMRLVGAPGNPAWIGAYHMAGGKPALGLGGLARPNLDGLLAERFNPYPAGMSQAVLASMIPTPVLNADGTFREGSLEGLINYYGPNNYDLMLWIEDISTRYSGGRHYRFTQSAGVKARGLYMRNCYGQGSMKQFVHKAGLYDVVIESPRFTLTGVERHYVADDQNRQAALATKGTQGDPDTPANVWYLDPFGWQGWSSEFVNGNSGNRAVGVEDGFGVDIGGVYGVYDDRTPDMGIRRCILARTDSPKFRDFTAGPAGRAVCAFEVQDEAATSSFPWDTPPYDSAESFAKYQSHDSLLENCIAIGYNHSFGLQSQAATRKGATHEGRPHSAAVYFYNLLSVNPIESHWLFQAGNNNAAYTPNPDRPPRVWACAHVGSAPVADRLEAKLAGAFRGNYFDQIPPDIYAGEAIVGGLEVPIAAFPDLSVLMETDADGWMNENQALAFREKVTDLCLPLVGIETGIPTAEATYPAEYTRTEPDGDFYGVPRGELLSVGPFALVDDGDQELAELEARVAELEQQVEALTLHADQVTENLTALDGRVSSIESGIAALCQTLNNGSP